MAGFVSKQFQMPKPMFFCFFCFFCLEEETWHFWTGCFSQILFLLLFLFRIPKSIQFSIYLRFVTGTNPPSRGHSPPPCHKFQWWFTKIWRIFSQKGGWNQYRQKNNYGMTLSKVNLKLFQTHTKLDIWKCFFICWQQNELWQPPNSVTIPEITIPEDLSISFFVTRTILYCHGKWMQTNAFGCLSMHFILYHLCQI